MSDHLIAEANRHAKALPKMQLPTTQPTHRDIAWYADECADLKKQLASLERENAALRKIADDAIMLIEHANPDAWNNGNTHPDGFGPDEGAVMASRFYSSLLDTRAAIDAVSKEEQP